MSYTCRHQLTITTGDPTEEDVAGALEERDGERPEGNFDWYDVLNRYAVDWKDREEAMLEVSLRWPRAVLVLDVQGEDQTQSVREFYRNGKTYTAEPVVPEFDPSLLDAGRGNREEREDRWVPDASIYAGLRARNVLDEALWDPQRGRRELPGGGRDRPAGPQPQDPRDAGDPVQRAPALPPRPRGADRHGPRRRAEAARTREGSPQGQDEVGTGPGAAGGQGRTTFQSAPS